ncbi:MAG: transporter substrate-binding domain-containing protein, partial [Pedobacter sp.]
DLDSIIARRYIRVLVPYSKTYYYTEGMKRYGLAYDLLNLFEKDLNKQLNLKPSTVRVIFIPVSREHIIPLLNSGRADMIASGYTITDERKKQIDFSLPTVTGIRDVLVAGPSAPPIRSIEELAGKKVYVRENTSYQSSLARVNELLHKKNLQPIDIQFTGPYLEAEDILEMVDQGMIPYTVVSEDIGTLWKNIFTNLKVYQKVAIDSNVSYGWAFRNSSPKLKAAVNKFIPKIQKGSLTGNMLYDKYIKSPGRLRNAQSKQALADLANFRKLFIKYGETYALDWLLLSAQAFQESQLKQETLSHAGAVGVMQVLPSTAKAPPISIPNIKTADNNIHAGVKYMRWLIVTSVIVSSSLLGMITSYATVTHTKTIVPKPEENIVGIEDNETDGIVDNPMLANNSGTEVDKSPEPSSTPLNMPSVEPYVDNDSKPYKLFLVMGTDVVYSYPGKKTHSTNGRTDAIMIVKMSDEKIDLISVPRDTRVYIPGFGYDKINAANVYGGPELVKKTIDNWLGIHIDDYALFNTFGVVQFVDLFGGVDFNIPKRMKYTDNSAKLHIDLYPGMQHLDGMKVHNFLRFRHDGMGDLN